MDLLHNETKPIKIDKLAQQVDDPAEDADKAIEQWRFSRKFDDFCVRGLNEEFVSPWPSNREGDPRMIHNSENKISQEKHARIEKLNNRICDSILKDKPSKIDKHIAHFEEE